MKSTEEPSSDSTRGNPSSSEETIGSLSRPGPTATAPSEKPALSLFPESLMEAIVNPVNMERAWKQVRANRGAHCANSGIGAIVGTRYSPSTASHPSMSSAEYSQLSQF